MLEQLWLNIVLVRGELAVSVRNSGTELTHVDEISLVTGAREWSCIDILLLLD